MKDENQGLAKDITTLKNYLISIILAAAGLIAVVTSHMSLVNEGFGQILTSLGATILAIGVTSFIHDLSVRRDLAREVTDIAQETVKTAMEEQFVILKNFSGTELVKVVSNLNLHYLQVAIRNAETEVRILQTWIPSLTSIEQDLIKAAENKAKIRILLMSNTSPILKARTDALGMGGKEENPMDWVDNNTQDLKRLAVANEAFSEKLEIRYYDILPPFSMYCADDDLMIGQFWHRMQSINGPHYHFKLGEESQIQDDEYNFSSDKIKNLGAYYVRNFDEIWKSATNEGGQRDRG